MAGETPQQKIALESAVKTAFAEMGWPRDAFGAPLTMIDVAAAELVPTVQYGNATVGPVRVVTFVPAGPPEQIKEEMRRWRAVCAEAVAEDRQTLHEEIRQRSAGGR